MRSLFTFTVVHLLLIYADVFCSPNNTTHTVVAKKDITSNNTVQIKGMLLVVAFQLSAIANRTASIHVDVRDAGDQFNTSSESVFYFCTVCLVFFAKFEMFCVVE